MNSKDAKIISETITNEQLKEMLDNAKNSIIDWTQRSSVNKSITKGVSWNIFGNDFDITKTHHSIVKKNMIWEFGDYLPEELKIQKKPKKELKKPFHQDPKFK